jgi:hypothetical protein
LHIGKQNYLIKIKFLGCALILGVAISSLLAMSAYAAPLNYTANENIVITSPAVNLTIQAGSVADSVVVSDTSLTVILSSTTGGTFVITSPQALNISTSGSGGTFTQVCSTGTETETITQTSSSETYTLTPSGSACVQSSGGGGGGGGSSSGGGTYSGGTTPTTPTTPTVPTAPVAPTPPLAGLSFPSQPNTQGSILVNDHGTFFLIAGSYKYGITNPGILESYGYTFSEAIKISADQQTLPTTSNLPPNNGALVKTASDPTVYLISNDYRYGFVSAAIFSKLGYKFSSVVVVTTPELDQLLVANPISDATQPHLPGTNIISKGTIYWIGEDYTLHPYPSLVVYNSWNIPNDFSKVVLANAADLALPVGNADVVRN